MEFLGDVHENLDVVDNSIVVLDDDDEKDDDGEKDDDDNGASPITLPLLRFKEASKASADKARDESFESSTAVIDEAKRTALRLVESTTAGEEEDELVTVQEAVDLWKRLGGNRLDRGRSLLDASEGSETEAKESLKPVAPIELLDQKDSRLADSEMDALNQGVASAKITFETTEDESPRKECESIVAETPSLDFPRARTRSFHMERHAAVGSSEGGDVVERVLDSWGVDTLCGVDEAALAAARGASANTMNDYPFPERIRNTEDVFADVVLVPKTEVSKTSLDSRDIFSNEFSSDDHPESLNNLLWDRLSGICEPMELPYEADLEQEGAATSGKA